jgi:predicted phage tail protein
MKKADQASRDRIKALEHKIETLEIEMKRAKDIVVIKNDEIEHITAQRNLHEKEHRKLRDEIEDFKTQQVKSDRQRVTNVDQSKIE